MCQSSWFTNFLTCINIKSSLVLEESKKQCVTLLYVNKTLGLTGAQHCVFYITDIWLACSQSRCYWTNVTSGSKVSVTTFTGPLVYRKLLNTNGIWIDNLKSLGS